MRSDASRPRAANQLRAMADRVYFEEYLNVLMFVLYLTGDVELIQYIIDGARNVFGKSEPCDFEAHTDFVNKLFTDEPKLVLPAKSYEEAREEERSSLDAEESGESMSLAQPDPQDVVYTEQLSEIIKLNIAFKTLDLMGQILRSFPGTLPKEIKVNLTRESYLLGLRCLRAVLKIAEMNLPGFRSYVAAIIREHKPILGDKELARTTDEAIVWLARRAAYAVLKRISYAVGLEVLAETYRRVLEASGVPTSFELIDLTVKLDHFKDFPLHELETAWKHADNNNFRQMLLMELVAQFMYLCPVDDRTHQKLCGLLKIKFVRRLPKG
jgi:hypothetical protein